MSVSSNLQTQPAWLDTFPNAAVAFGFDATGMWFTGDADNVPYPIRTNYDIDGETTVVVIYTFVHAEVDFGGPGGQACPDQGICFFKADAEPYWDWNENTSRIAVQYDCGTPKVVGQVNDEESYVGSEYTLTVGNTYTARVTYDPVAETITHELFDGSSVEDTLLDTITLENERLSAGAYRIGFHADLDTEISEKAYFTSLEISAAPVEIFTRVFRALHFPHRRRQTVSDVDLTPINVQPGEVLYDETEGTVYAGLDDNTAVEIFSSGGGIGPNNYIESAVTGITGAVAVTNIVSMTQAAYDALATKAATTLYIING